MLHRVLSFRSFHIRTACQTCHKFIQQGERLFGPIRCYSSQKQECREEKDLHTLEEGKSYQLMDFELPKSLGPVPIKNLQVLKSIKKIRKESSFLINLFLGHFDIDFLTYPEVLYGRQTFLDLRNQHEMVKRNFPDMVTDAVTVSKFNLDRLWTLSVSETTNIFEAIGASLSFTTDNIKHVNAIFNKETSSQDFFSRSSKHPVANPDIQRMLFTLIINNCLSMQAISRSKNEQLKEFMMDQFEKNDKLKVGFGWTEREFGLGALPYNDWSSEAKLTLDKSSWVISGTKSRIMKDDYDYYVVYCRTHEFPEEELPKHMMMGEGPPPGVVGLLLRKDQIAKIEYETEAGVDYQTIIFDSVVLPRESFEVTQAQPFGVEAQNIKGIGHLATASFVLGQMKTTLNTLYRYLMVERKPLLGCELVEALLAEMTYLIYALESVVYMVGAMYDSFDENYDTHIYFEAAAAKILAIDYAKEVLQKAQSIYGSKMLVTSPFLDLIHVLDSFLDGSLHYKLLIGVQGMRHVGQYKNDHINKSRFPILYPTYNLKQYVMKKKLRSENPLIPRDLKGYLHPTLQTQGTLLEGNVNKLEYASESMLLQWAKHITYHQCDLYRLGCIALDLFMLTCSLSRASRAYCDGVRNGDAEITVATALTSDTNHRIERYLDELYRSNLNTNELRNKEVHSRNQKYYGYFAFPPLDKLFF